MRAGPCYKPNALTARAISSWGRNGSRFIKRLAVAGHRDRLGIGVRRRVLLADDAYHPELAVFCRDIGVRAVCLAGAGRRLAAATLPVFFRLPDHRSDRLRVRMAAVASELAG